MAQIKTTPTPLDPRAFINGVADERRRTDCHELIALMQAVTGHPPRMWGTSIVGFDQYQYMYASGQKADMLLTGFSPRKQDLVLYLGPGLENRALLARLGTHRTGKGCLYLKGLDEVDRTVLRALVQASVAAMRKKYPA